MCCMIFSYNVPVVWWMSIKNLFLLSKQLGGKKVAAMHQSPLPLSEKSIFAAKSRKVQLEQKLHRLGTSNTVLRSTTMQCVFCLVFHSSASNFIMNCTAIYSRIDLQLTSVLMHHNTFLFHCDDLRSIRFTFNHILQCKRLRCFSPPVLCILCLLK